MANKPTPRQLSYLRSLAERTGQTFTYPHAFAEASREIDRLKAIPSESRAERRIERKEIADQLATGPADSARVREDEISGRGSSATWAHNAQRDAEPKSERPAPKRTAPVVGKRTELARYTVAEGERVVYGQRVDGVVRVTDRPATPGSRHRSYPCRARPSDQGRARRSRARLRRRGRAHGRPAAGQLPRGPLPGRSRMSPAEPLFLHALVAGALAYEIGDEIWQQSLAEAIETEAQTIVDDAGAAELEDATEASRNHLRDQVIADMTAALTRAGDTYRGPDGIRYALTRSPAPPHSRHRIGGSPDPPRRPRILLAEPDDATRLFLTDNLAADGYEVQAVADRDAALDQLVDGDADLILVDVNGDTRSVAALQLPWRLRHSCSPASGSSYALWSRLLQWD